MRGSNAERRQAANWLTLGRWLLRGPSRRDVLLTSTIHARVPRPLVCKQGGTVGTTTTSVLCVTIKVTSSGTAPNVSSTRRERRPWSGPRPDPHLAETVHKSASATPRASGYKAASKAVVPETEPAAPEASTQNDDDYVCIRGPREKMAPVDNGLTETVQHQVSRSTGSQNAAPVLHSAPVQLPAPASQQSGGDSSTIPFARVSVLQPGESCDTSVDMMKTKRHLEALTHPVAERLAISGASAPVRLRWSWTLVQALQQYRRS